MIDYQPIAAGTEVLQPYISFKKILKMHAIAFLYNYNQE